MKVANLEVIDQEELVQRRRTEMTPLHEKIQQLQDDPTKHNELLHLAIFDLPEEVGRAHTVKQNMTNVYGTDVGVSGLEFSVFRNRANTEEILGVIYKPDSAVPGAWEAFVEDKAKKAAEAKERAAQRKIQAAIEAQSQEPEPEQAVAS